MTKEYDIKPQELVASIVEANKQFLDLPEPILAPINIYTGSYEKKYPLLRELGTKQLEVMLWFASNIPVEDDAMEMKYDLSARQQRVVKAILPMFRKYEMDVSEFWVKRYTKFFVHDMCKEGASVINMMERAVHPVFYDKINVVFGLDNDESYLSYVNDPIFKHRAKWLGEILNHPNDKLVNLVFGLVEGVSLFSMFALLRSFQANGINRIKATVKGTKQSAEDELLHSQYLATSFRYYYVELGKTINDEPEYLNALLEMTKNVIEMELFIIDELLETQKGYTEFNGVLISEYKKFVKKLANNYLIALGVDEASLPYDVTHSDLEDWFELQNIAFAETDFFDKGESKEYEKKFVGMSFEPQDDLLEKVKMLYSNPNVMTGI